MNTIADADIPAGNNIANNTIMGADGNIVEPIDSIVIYEHYCKKDDCNRVLTLNLVADTPAHKKGWELVQGRDLMTVGVSLGNGYFSRERLEMILMGMANYFKEVVVIVPDLPALHTYRALGYNEHDAMEKVKNHRQGVERCYRRVSEQVLLNFGRQNIKILMWGDDFTQEKYYQQACDRAFEIYRNNPEFSKTILHNTEHYILARLEGQNVQQLGGMKNIAKKAAHYLIEEMAFHEQLHIVLGREPIVSYYRELELGINYINGDYDNLQNEHVGYVTYNIIDGE